MTGGIKTLLKSKKFTSTGSVDWLDELLCLRYNKQDFHEAVLLPVTVFPFRSFSTVPRIIFSMNLSGTELTLTGL